MNARLPVRVIVSTGLLVVVAAGCAERPRPEAGAITRACAGHGRVGARGRDAVVFRGRRKRPRQDDGGRVEPDAGDHRGHHRPPGRSSPSRRLLVRLDSTRRRGIVGADRGRSAGSAIVGDRRRRRRRLGRRRRWCLRARRTSASPGLYSRRSATADERDRAVAEKAAAEGRAAAARARRSPRRPHAMPRAKPPRMSDIVSGYATLVAPFDGVVTDRYVDPGSMASPGLALLTLEGRGTSAWRCRWTSHARAFVRRASPSKSSSTRRWSRLGRSRSGPARSRRLDSASHGFLVKIDLPDSVAWRSGQFGRARFAGAARRTLAVPAAAVVRRGQLTFVFALRTAVPGCGRFRSARSSAGGSRCWQGCAMATG